VATDTSKIIDLWIDGVLRDADPGYAWDSLWTRLGLRPQPGPQTDFLASEADITIYGGSAGGGKTFGELLDPLQWVHVPGFGAVIFRRTTTQVRAEGGIRVGISSFRDIGTKTSVCNKLLHLGKPAVTICYTRGGSP
jgi:hypothetical protein